MRWRRWRGWITGTAWSGSVSRDLHQNLDNEYLLSRERAGRALPRLQDQAPHERNIVSGFHRWLRLENITRLLAPVPPADVIGVPQSARDEVEEGIKWLVSATQETPPTAS